jgi:hypothetical protein
MAKGTNGKRNKWQKEQMAKGTDEKKEQMRKRNR